MNFSFFLNFIIFRSIIIYLNMMITFSFFAFAFLLFYLMNAFSFNFFLAYTFFWVFIFILVLLFAILFMIKKFNWTFFQRIVNYFYILCIILVCIINRNCVINHITISDICMIINGKSLISMIIILFFN